MAGFWNESQFCTFAFVGQSTSDVGAGLGGEGSVRI